MPRELQQLLRVLIIEDSVDDADLAEMALRDAGWRVAATRVEDAAGLRGALAQEHDIVLCDHTLPALDAREALRLLQQAEVDVPFLVVSGTISVELAVELMGLGASDFVLKGDLRRLPAAVAREVEEAVRRREHRRVRAQLAAAERLATVGTLTAGLVHELKNPLSVLSPNLRFVGEELNRLAGTEAHDAVEPLLSPLAEAIEASELMRALAGDVRMLTPPSSGPAAAGRIEPVSLSEVLDAAARLGGHELRRRCRVIKEYGSAPKVKGDRAALSQVFLNLILNAAHALTRRSPDENRVTLRVRPGVANQVIAEVQDNGVGMDAGVQARIFDPFFTTKGNEGTGLGLAIARRIVEEHGGRIDVSSFPGAGTTVAVILPAGEPARARRATSRSRVLVIDDDRVIRTVIARIVADHHDVSTAGSVAEAIQLIETRPFDVIVCDVTMPGQSGLDLQSYLEEHHPLLATRTCMLSGAVGTPREADLRARLPADRLLAKPFSIEDLLSTIARLLGPAE